MFSSCLFCDCVQHVALVIVEVPIIYLPVSSIAVNAFLSIKQKETIFLSFFNS